MTHPFGKNKSITVFGASGVKNVVALILFVAHFPCLVMFPVVNAQRLEAKGEWGDIFSGRNSIIGSVYAIVVDRSGDVYIGGLFTRAGDVDAANVARWTGSNWEPLGAGLNGEVNTLAIDDRGVIYAGGKFTASDTLVVNGIAKWEEGSWKAMGAGIKKEPDLYGPYPFVAAITVASDDKIYIGGDFTEIDGRSARGIAVWDGNQWKDLGGGVDGGFCVDALYDNVFAIEIDENGEVFVGGDFIGAGGTSAPGVAVWSAGAWRAVGAGNEVGCAAVRTIAFSSIGTLFGGGFDTFDGVEVNGLAKWAGGMAEAVLDADGLPVAGVATATFVGAVAVASSGIYAGYRFNDSNNQSKGGVARLVGNSWEELAGGLSQWAIVDVIVPVGDSIYVGGENLQEINDTTFSGLALWVNNRTNVGVIPLLPEHKLSRVRSIYPTPFLNALTIDVEVIGSAGERFSLEVYNVLGQHVATIVDRSLSAGVHQIRWVPEHLPSGVYIISQRSIEGLWTIPVIKY